MNREQAEQYTTFINSLCESGNLNWDWLDSLGSDARDHVRQNPKYIGREQISEDEFENDYGGHSILGFFDEIDQSASGVYIMYFDNKIQKIGKSSASLYRRLKGYARFDSDSLAHPDTGSDKTSQRQRRAIAEAGLSGLYVLALQPDRTQLDFNMLQIKVQAFSFDAHSFEEKLIERARADASNNPLKFGR